MKIAVVLLLSFVLSACAGSATALPIIPTHQISQQLPSEIKTPTIIAATLRPFPSPTNPRKPTETHALTATPSVTSTVHQSTLNPTEATQAVLTEQAMALRNTQIAAFSPACDDPSHYTFSPKGNWLALSCGYKRDQTLQVYSKAGQKWVVQFKDYVAKEFISDGYPPMGSLYPVHWTSDENYLYFRSAIGFSGGGTCFCGWDGQGLYRLNMDNGTVSTTLPPLLGPDQYIISFSPSGRWLAYNTGVPTILDLQTGEEIILQEGKNSIGDFTWSPDSSQLAYATCQPSEDYATVKKASIKIFSLETRKSKTILETEKAFLRIDFGDDKRLKIYDDFIYPPNYMYFDWSTDQWITPTVTPTP